MTDKLPPNLLALFAPRPALRYLPPADHAPEERKTARITGVAQYLPQLQEEFGNYKPTESWLEARDRRTLETQAQQTYMTGEGAKELYKPTEDANIRGDAFKTLFVARLSYETDIKDLEREFGRFGPIERIRIVTNNGESKKKDGSVNKKKGKSKGYAFVVFEREKDMKGKQIRRRCISLFTDILQLPTKRPITSSSAVARSSSTWSAVARSLAGARDASAVDWVVAITRKPSLPSLQVTVHRLAPEASGVASEVASTAAAASVAEVAAALGVGSAEAVVDMEAEVASATRMVLRLMALRPVRDPAVVMEVAARVVGEEEAMVGMTTVDEAMRTTSQFHLGAAAATAIATLAGMVVVKIGREGMTEVGMTNRDRAGGIEHAVRSGKAFHPTLTDEVSARLT